MEQERGGPAMKRAGLRLDRVSPYHCTLAEISLAAQRSADPPTTGLHPST
jgi:hypothetical protein